MKILKILMYICVHWGLGNRTSMVTETPLCDSLNVQILSIQYGYRDLLWYGYQDRLGIGTTVSTILLPRPTLCTDTKIRADTEAPSCTDTETALVSVLRIPRPQCMQIIKITITTHTWTDLEFSPKCNLTREDGTSDRARDTCNKYQIL